jgi:IclR family KDG regulon transcriptional repressor
MDYTITAVDRSLRVLETLAEHPGLSISDIATLTGYTRSLVFRMIFTLEQRGYVIKDPMHRTYTIGYRPLYLAAHAQDQLQVLRAATPYLEDLAGKCEDNINLLVRDGTTSVCIFARRSVEQSQLYAQVGRRVPLHVGGGPKILLAFAPPDVQEEVLSASLETFTTRTIVDREALEAVLLGIRQSGLSESHGEIDLDAFSLGGAVFDRNGDVIAALSIAGPAARLKQKSADFYRRLVLDTSRQISLAMGWRSKLGAVV